MFSKALDGKVILVIELGPELVEPCGSSRKMLVEKPLRRSRKYTSCGEKLINLVLHLDFIFYSFLFLFFVRFMRLRRHYDRILMGTLPSENLAGIGGW